MRSIGSTSAPSVLGAPISGSRARRPGERMPREPRRDRRLRDVEEEPTQLPLLAHRRRQKAVDGDGQRRRRPAEQQQEHEDEGFGNRDGGGNLGNLERERSADPRQGREHEPGRRDRFAHEPDRAVDDRSSAERDHGGDIELPVAGAREATRRSISGPVLPVRFTPWPHHLCSGLGDRRNRAAVQRAHVSGGPRGLVQRFIASPTKSASDAQS